MDRIAMRPIAAGPRAAPSFERSHGSIYTALVVVLSLWLVIAVLYALARML